MNLSEIKTLVNLIETKSKFGYQSLSIGNYDSIESKTFFDLSGIIDRLFYKSYIVTERSLINHIPDFSIISINCCTNDGNFIKYESWEKFIQGLLTHKDIEFINLLKRENGKIIIDKKITNESI